jgi:hypothetical protein
MVVLCLSTYSACGSTQGGINLEEVEPGMEDRNNVDGKQDANSPVLRTSEYLDDSSPTIDLHVEFSTFGFEPQSAGIHYNIDYNPCPHFPIGNSGVWRQTYADYLGTNENGRNVFKATIRLQGFFEHDPVFIRYAIFATDRNSPNTFWDNNSGEDYFYIFDKSANTLVDYKYQLTDDSVTLDLYTIHRFGQDEVVMVYSLDKWETTREAVAELIEEKSIDHWQVTIPIEAEDKEILFAVAIKIDGSTLWANNDGQDYHIGLVESEPIEIFFGQDDIVVNGTLKAGGYFKVVYNREPLCGTCVYGRCTYDMELQYRFYGDNTFWRHHLHQKIDNPNNWDTEYPPVMISEPIYIPLDAVNLSMWIFQEGWQPFCKDWDSNNGNDYFFDVE